MNPHLRPRSRLAVSEKLVALFLALCPWAFGSTYYVSTTGSDSNSGTQSAPFRHLSKAAAAAQSPGDTVIVMDGTYDNEGRVSPSYVVTLQHSGTAGNPITFEAQHRGKAILDSMNTSTTTTCNGAYAYFNLYNASFIVIQGFVIQRGCDEGIHSNDSAHDITIRWNEIRNIANHTVTDQIGRDGIYLNSSEYNFTFDGNIFHDIGRTDGQTLLHFDHGIYAHATNLTIINNIFYNMTRGWSIQLADGAANWLVANNTFAFPNTGSGEAGQIEFWGTNSNITLRNNIFYEPSGSALNQYQATISGSVFDHDIVYGVSSIMSGSTAGFSIGTNQIGANPAFVSPSTYNFQTQSGSPAIDAGMNLSSVPMDIMGTSRPQGASTDVGAYEYAGGVVSPPVVSTTFSLSPSASSVSIVQGQSATDDVTATLLTGSAASVSFTTSSLPAGVTAFFNSTSCTITCSATLTVSAATTAATGTYTLAVTASGGGSTATTNISLTITAASTGSTGSTGGTGNTGGGDITTGLVAEWPLNEMGGTVANDVSGNGNTGSIQYGNGNFWYGARGPCLWFDGPGSVVTVPESASLEETNALTVAFWVDPNPNTNLDPRVVSKLYDWDVKLNGLNQYPQFTVGTQYAQLNYPLPSYTWHHVAFTFSNGHVTGYVDGVPVSFLLYTFTSSRRTRALPQWADGLLLGTDYTLSNSLIGSLQDVRIYNRALSATDIATLYSATK